jgi:MFS family permease
VFSRAVLSCFIVAGLIHAATYLLNTILPLHVVALGGSKTQVGMLFSVSTVVSMILRPLVGGWNDRYGFRPVALPGALVLVLTAVGLRWASAPIEVIALMAGTGLSNGLVSTSVGVLVARASPAAQRGEALSLYYVATSLGFAIGPPLGLLLYQRQGLSAGLWLATILATVIVLLVWSLTDRSALPLPGAVTRMRLYSPHAVPVSCALALLNLGNSSVYGLLPLYAMTHGRGENIGWFYALFSGWMIACRLLLRRAADRQGRAHVIAPAMASIALAYFVLAIPPTVLSLALGALLLGSGAALLYPTLVALLVDRTPELERGLAIGTLSASFDVGIVLGSLLIGFTVERTSYAVGFGLAGAMAVLGLASFVLTERARLRVVPPPPAGVSS